MGSLRRFIQDKGRTSKPQVWEVQQTDNCVLTVWGQLGGAMQDTVQTFEAVNKGKSNEKSPAEVAKKACEDLIKGKLKAGYYEVNLKTNKPLAKKKSQEGFDFNSPPTNFKAFKPQNSMNAYMTKKAQALEAVFSRKRDGYMHYLVTNDDGEPTLYSSNMATSHNLEPDAQWFERYPHLEEEVRKMDLPPRTMLLGELCTSAISHGNDLGHAVDDFQYVGSIIKSLTPRALELQEKHGRLAYCVWDVMFCNGDPLAKDSCFRERFNGLVSWLESAKTEWITVPEIVDLREGGFVVTSYDGDDLHLEYDDLDDPVNDIVNWAKEQKWEGYVVIDPEAPYGDRAWSFHGKNERPKEICKLKPDIDVDVIVYWDPSKKLGERGKGKHSGQVGSVDAFLWDGKGEVSVGKVGTGITDEQAKKFANPKLYPMVWQITAKGWTDGGKLRHASLERVRDDKSPEECGIEQRPGGQ